jgi:hypothetical protein
VSFAPLPATAAGRTRRASIWGRSTSGSRSAKIEADGAGCWRVNGTRAPHLDVDLESSALTNALPAVIGSHETELTATRL